MLAKRREKEEEKAEPDVEDEKVSIKRLGYQEEGEEEVGRKRSVRLSVPELRELWAQRLPKAQVLFMSARYGAGVPQLLAELVQHCPLGPLYFPEDTFTTRDERFFVSEMIRESLFMQFKDEIPYSCEVRIDSFKDKSEDLSVIEATILVSRDSQKAIVIGKGGKALKALGVVARARLEEFLGRRVFLQLFVKTDKDWRSSAEALVKYGYVANDNYG